MTWFVIRTNIKAEDKAERNLRAAGFVVYVPRFRTEYFDRRRTVWRESTHLLIKRYLFVRQFDTPDWFRLRACEGVEGVLGTRDPKTGDVRYCPVPDVDVATIENLERDLVFDTTREAQIRRGEIGRTRRETAAKRFKPGKVYRAVDGPFTGHVGVVNGVKANGGIELLLNLFGRDTVVEFTDQQIEAEVVEAQRAAA